MVSRGNRWRGSVFANKLYRGGGGLKKTDCQLTANEEGCDKSRCHKNITEPYGDDPVNIIVTQPKFSAPPSLGDNNYLNGPIIKFTLIDQFVISCLLTLGIGYQPWSYKFNLSFLSVFHSEL